MLNRILSHKSGLLILFLCMLSICPSCGKTNQILSKSDAGTPYSDWEQSPTGSAKYLDGDTVLISIFLDDTDAQWTNSDMELVKENMEIACRFLKAEGKRYDKDVNLIYDIDENPDLEYHYKMNYAFPGSSSAAQEGALGLAAMKLLLDVNEYIHSNINIENIMSKYEVNSVGFLVFIDNEASKATTYSYHVGYEGQFYCEVCFINLRWEKTTDNVNPETYAHEILHLFGARDLYCTNETDGVTKEFVDYAYEQYPKDIMLGASAKTVSWHNKITENITDITAYFLGWKDNVYETYLFPTIKMNQKASFAITEEKDEDYEEYKAPSRRRKAKNFLFNALYICIIVIFFIYDIKIILQKQKKQSEETQQKM